MVSRSMPPAELDFRFNLASNNMTYQEFEIKIHSLIATDEIEAAIQLLCKYFHKHASLNKILLQSGRYHALKKDQFNGIVDHATVQQTLNQLRVNILEFVRLEKDGWVDSIPVHTIRSTLKSSVARTTVLWILHHDSNGLTVTQLFERSRTKSRKYIYQAIAELETNDLVEKIKKGRVTRWKLSEKGRKLTKEFENSLLFGLKET